MNSWGNNNDHAEVERLLEAAKDEVLLNLSVDSHLKSRRLSPDDDLLPSDLLRRFHALKSPSNQQSSSAASTQPRHQQPLDLPNNDDDLFARFAALKASDSYSSSSSANTTAPAAPPHGVLSNYQDDDEDDEESEVDKIIQWAKDAARLDPSPSSDLDDDEANADNDEADDADEEKEEEEYKKSKGCKKQDNR